MNVHLPRKDRVKPRDLYKPLNDDDTRERVPYTVDELRNAAQILNDYGSASTRQE